ncbi:ParA family protein [Botrimarina mediterranea]|uniref:ParA family protein n=1 Tax=Botrimarina mediterranea TaxID=2528022 RepID=UPI00118C37D4|nr:MinD/ParA/CobQ/CobA-like protein [Planctomycetes bacterium K2D]
MILGLGNSKGGVGKSTIAANLVVELCDRGYPTALIDAEKNSPTARRLLKYDPTLVVKGASSLEEIDEAVEQLAQSGHHVVIDSPGRSGDELTALCLASDIVLIPMQTTEQDLLQTTDVLTLVRAFQRRMAGRPQAAIILNATRRRDIAARRFREGLLPLGVPVAKTQLRRLDDYRFSVSVMRDSELNRQGAADDIRTLVDELVMPHLNHQGVANEQ